MIIKELYLKNFGKFSEKRISLDEHIQVFYGENEYGKSTVYAFIKAMLFGMERGRGRAALKDDFSRYEPWENPQYYAGEMRFVCGERTFCLKRQFDRYGRKAVLYCEDDGEELSIEDGDLEMLLCGITADSFENMAAIGQLTARPGQTLAEELKNYAANYYASGSSEIDLKRALDVLKERKKQTERDIRRCEETQKRELEKLEVAERYIEQEMEKLRGNAIRAKERLSGLSELAAEGKTGGHREARRVTSGLPKVSVMLCMLGALLLAAGIWRLTAEHFLTNAIPEGILPAGIVFLAVGICSFLTGIVRNRFVLGMRVGKIVESSQEKPGTAEADKAELWEEEPGAAETVRTDMLRAKWEIQQIQGQLTEKRIEYDNLQEQKAERMEPGEELERLVERKEALDLAMERLMACSADMTEGFGKCLNRKASQILETVTSGKYTRLFVGENLQLSVFGPDEAGGRRIPVERLSRGTVEQIYFALRMAALDLLYEEKIPVIFDDAFGCYDEKRLKSTLKWLSNLDRQVIIFTCQRREKEMIQLKKRK